MPLTGAMLLGGAPVVVVITLVFSMLFLLFAYFIVTAKTRRQAIAVATVGMLSVTLIAPPPVQGAGLWSAIQDVLNVIQGVIKTALNAINGVRAAVRDFYEQVAWPVSLINEAKAMVTQMIGQYRSLMQNIFNTNLKSTTLPYPGVLENVIRNRQTTDFEGLTISFGNTY